MEVWVSPESQFEEDPGTECFISGHSIYFQSFLLTIFLILFVIALGSVDLLLQNGSFFFEICCSSLYSVSGFTFSCPFIMTSRTMNHTLVTARSGAYETVSFAQLQNFSLSYFWGQYSCLEPNKKQGIFYKSRYQLHHTLKEGMLMLNNSY